MEVARSSYRESDWSFYSALRLSREIIQRSCWFLRFEIESMPKNVLNVRFVFRWKFFRWVDFVRLSCIVFLVREIKVHEQSRLHWNVHILLIACSSSMRWTRWSVLSMYMLPLLLLSDVIHVWRVLRTPCLEFSRQCHKYRTIDHQTIDYWMIDYRTIDYPKRSIIAR